MFSWYVYVIHRTSSATLDTLVMLSFCVSCLRERLHMLSIVGLIVVQQEATFESCETFLFSSDFSEPMTYHFMVFFYFFFQFLHVFIF